jgi:hypothetical protein
VPETDFTGTVPAIYTVTDDGSPAATDTATLTIDVFGSEPLAPNPPVAQDDTNTTEIGVPVSDNVITPNDTDPDGQTLTVISVLMDTDGDGLADDTVVAGATATVYGKDVNGNIVQAGTLVIAADGGYTFTPNATFIGDVPAVYTIEDTDDLTDSATLTITIVPDAGNSTFANDDANAGPQDVDQTGNILDNDNDPEGNDQDVTTISVDTDGDGTREAITPVAGVPTNVYQYDPVTMTDVLIGALTVDPETGAYVWDPAAGFIGTAVVPYTITDDGSPVATDAATLYLTTTPGFDYGDAPSSYGDAAAILDPDLYLGSGATQDLTLRYDNGDADDGPDFANATVTASGYTLEVAVTNTTGSSVWLAGWIDLDKDGLFQSDELQSVEVPAGATSVELTWPAAGGLSGMSWTRFRIATTELEAEAATGSGGIGEVEDYSIDLATLPVTVAYFSSTPSGDSANVTWWSGTEVANAGYVVYGEDADGTRVPLSGLVPGGGDSTVPLEYRVEVSGPVATLWLADVDLRGVETVHGPYALGDTVGRVPKPVRIDWGAARAEAVRSERAANNQRTKAQNDKTAEALAAETAKNSSTTAPGNSSKGKGNGNGNANGGGNGGGNGNGGGSGNVGAGNSATLRVQATGLHRVSFADMLATGLDWTGVSMNSLAVIDSTGTPVPVITSGGKTFGPGEYVEFWATSIDTVYTGTNAYRLVVDGSKRITMSSDRAKVPSPDVASATTSMETVVSEAQNFYSFSTPGDDPWYSDYVFSFGPTSTTVNLDRVAPGPGSIAVQVFGVFDFIPGNDHDVRVAVNGVEVGGVVFDGTDAATLTATIPAGILVEGANTVVVTANVVDGMPYDWVNLDQISVTYPRFIAATGGVAVFDAATPNIAVGGFTGASVDVLRFDGAGVTRVVNYNPTLQPDGTYTIQFAGSPSPARYAVVQGGATTLPAISASRIPSGLLAGSADLLIISHSAFIGHLGDLVAARQAQGLTVKVIDVADLYAAYAGEVFDPAAIKAYIGDAAVAFDNPSVLLVGADTYDYRDFGGTGAVSFIPTLYGDVGVGDVHWSPIDPAFVDLDGDRVPDLPLGRFPARDLTDLATMIRKATTYTPDSKAVFAAERGFGASADSIAESLPGSRDITTAYLDDLTLDQARSALVGAINSGFGLTVFFGHSSTDQWTSEGLLTTADIPKLTNTADPTLVVQFGCWNTYFVHPTIESLGVGLLSEQGGAASVLGATTLTSVVHDAMFGPPLMDALATSATIGEAMTAAKQELAASVSAPDITLGWTLLGDPTAPSLAGL